MPRSPVWTEGWACADFAIRVQDAGGTFSAGPAGQGWLIRAEFPLRDSADSRLVLLATDLGGKAPS